MATRSVMTVPLYRASGTHPVLSRPLTMAEATRATDNLEVLANPVRMQLLSMLASRAEEVCVCDLEAAVPVKQPTVSHHLKLLRAAGLVHSKRRGLYVYYAVNRKALDTLLDRISGQLAVFR